MTDFPSLPADEERRQAHRLRPRGQDRRSARGDPGASTTLDHLYAIHAATGQVLALVPDRAQAFVVARQNEFSPVSVH